MQKKKEIKKPILKIDVDGVIRDIIPAMCFLYNAKFNMSLKREDITEYDLSKSFPLLGNDAFDFFFTDEKNSELVLKKMAYVMPDAREAINLLKKYYEIHLVTYQPSTEAKIFTLQWLNDSAKIHYDAIHFVSDKTCVEAQWIIDDCPKYLEEENKHNSFVSIACINAPYNADFNLQNGYLLRYDSLMDFAEERLAYHQKIS